MGLICGNTTSLFRWRFFCWRSRETRH